MHGGGAGDVVGLGLAFIDAVGAVGHDEQVNGAVEAGRNVEGMGDAVAGAHVESAGMFHVAEVEVGAAVEDLVEGEVHRVIPFLRGGGAVVQDGPGEGHGLAAEGLGRDVDGGDQQVGVGERNM